MKKAKIMLTATALVAVVGGAMAYTVQSRTPANYCITDTGTSCATGAATQSGHAVIRGAIIISYATTTTTTCPTSGLDCTGQGTFIAIGD